MGRNQTLSESNSIVIGFLFFLFFFFLLLFSPLNMYYQVRPVRDAACEYRLIPR